MKAPGPASAGVGRAVLRPPFVKRCGNVLAALPVFLGWSLAGRLCAATKAADRIPALRPPRGEIAPGFWEEYGLLAVAGGLLAVVLLGLAGWFLSRRKPAAAPAAVTVARQALAALRQQPEEGAVLSRVSQILRHYLIAAFGLPPEELTSTEFCRLLREHQAVGPELSAAIAEFLRRCDERKFAPWAPRPALGAVERAFELIEAAEQRLARLRQAAQAAAASPAAKENEGRGALLQGLNL